MLGQEVLRAVEASGVAGPIACLACPSTFAAMQALGTTRTLYLFEYDRRFGAKSPNFVYYDFKSPAEVPGHLVGQCAAVVLDPPYLNADTLRAFASTVFLLAKDPARSPIVLCTGSVLCAPAR
jgi:hypothetical protein